MNKKQKSAVFELSTRTPTRKVHSRTSVIACFTIEFDLVFYKDIFFRMQKIVATSANCKDLFNVNSKMFYKWAKKMFLLCYSAEVYTKFKRLHNCENYFIVSRIFERKFIIYWDVWDGQCDRNRTIIRQSIL